jgi:alkylation response protein AidB-like acyl-CoA dehydrogenase
LLAGEAFATVGISHLTTSRQHLAVPVMRVIEGGGAGAYRMTGVAPWVTGAVHADVIVLAGTLDDGRELLAALPTDHPAMVRGPGAGLVALSASCTDQVRLEDYPVTAEMVIAGPHRDVMRSGFGAGTGGLQTSTLAIGLARAAVDYLAKEGERRVELGRVAESLGREVGLLEERLMGASAGSGEDTHAIRGEANRLVLRATQAALVAAKGAGFVEDHPVGRWCREALFFLVWSCPHPVASGQLCELAGLDPNFRP